MLRKNEYKMFVEKQLSNTVIELNTVDLSTDEINMPYKLPSIWNTYTKLNYPPIFTNFEDGSVSIDNLAKICIRKLVNISSNIYNLEYNNDDLQFTIFDLNILDINKSVKNIINADPSNPDGYNPILKDDDNNILFFNPLEWIISIQNKIVKIINLNKKIKEPLTLIFIKYTGEYGGINEVVSYTGPRGVTGTSGIINYDFINIGFTGPTGLESIGPTGIQGIQGITGPTGVQGHTGITGPTGIQGIQGITGHTGISGIRGVKGSTGSQGYIGIQGSTGITGIRGNIGHEGLPGLLSVRGSTGITGNQGLQGHTGIQGSQGLQGPTGITGLQGSIGYMGYRGHIGYQGIQGIQGPTGNQGPTGYTGHVGNQGLQGPTGPIGNQGPTGSIGYVGNQGLQGIQGPAGNQGPTGYTGYQGDIGNITGSTGITGLTGPTGRNSITGPTGGIFIPNSLNILKDCKYDSNTNFLLLGYKSDNNQTPNNTIIIGNENLIHYNNSNSNIISLGHNTLNNLTSGENMISIGNYNSYNMLNGNENICIGSNAMNSIQSLINTIVIGHNSGIYDTNLSPVVNSSISNGIYIGNNIISTNNSDNEIVIGHNITGNGSNTITLGDENFTTFYAGTNSLTSLSDERDKTDICKIENSIEIINKINPIMFTWNFRDNKLFKKINNSTNSGFNAQELLEIQKNNKQFLNLVVDKNPNKLYINKENLLPIIVQSIKDIHQICLDLKQKIS